MTDITELRKLIEDSGKTMKAVAKQSGIVRETLYNRLDGKGEFKASEIQGLALALNLTNEQRDAIFFNYKV